MWRETSLMCDRVVHIANSKTNVCAVSVLCPGSLSDIPVEAWKNKIKWYWNHATEGFGSNRRGADGIRVEKFHRIHYIKNSRRDSQDDDGIKV